MYNKKMKVLYLVNIPSPYRIDFFNELGLYCELTVLFERRTSKERDKSWHNNNFHNFKGTYLKGKKIHKNTALSVEVLKYLSDKSYDIIIVGGYATPTGLLAVKYLNLMRIPFVLNTDGGLIKKDSKLKHLIKKSLISKADYWLSTSKETTKYLLHYGAQKDKIFNYPFTSTLDQDLLADPLNCNQKMKIKKTLNIKEEYVILSVGQFIPRKGFDTLINAAKSLPKDIGIYIIGGVPPKEYVDLVSENDLYNVHFLEFKKKEELKQFYLASDIFVLPTREDIWGLVINEAISNALPIITTNRCVAGLELVNNGSNGFIVPIDNPGYIVEKVLEIRNNENLQEHMGRRSLEVAKKYTIEQMALRHIQVFETVVRNG